MIIEINCWEFTRRFGWNL